MEPDCYPCTTLAVLGERLDQITRRQDGDIASIRADIGDVSQMIHDLKSQSDRWRGGLGMLLTLSGFAGGLGGLIGFIAGKGH